MKSVGSEQTASGDPGRDTGDTLQSLEFPGTVCFKDYSRIP